MGEDGLARLKGGDIDETGNMALEVSEVGCHHEAAEVCPVQIISIQE